MGYEIHFFPPEKKMEEYKPWGFDKPSYESAEKRVESARLQLLTYCLKNHQEDGCYKIERQIQFLLSLLNAAIEQEEKEIAYKRWLNDEEHDLWYCGWEFAHGGRHDLEDLMKPAVEDLLVLTDVVETPDYFKDHDGFYEKYKDVESRIADYIEMVCEYHVHKIIEDLDEYKKTYDDYDDIQTQVKRMADDILHDKEVKVVENNEETINETFARIASELLPSKEGKTDEENNEEEYGLMNSNGDKDFD